MSAVRGKSKSVCIAFANGCPRARMNAAWFSSYFQANGWSVCFDLRRADLVVAFGCAVNARSERKAIRLLSVVENRRKVGSTLIIAGCIGGIAVESLSKRFEAILLPPVANDALDDIICADRKLKTIEDCNLISAFIRKSQSCFGVLDRFVSEFEPSTLFLRRVRDKLWPNDGNGRDDDAFLIRLARGCLDECTYCALKHSNGSLVSKASDQILREFHDGIKRGYEHFVILAEDIGAYGQDIGSNIAVLLEQILSCDGSFSVDLKEFNPRWFLTYQEELLGICEKYAARINSIIFPMQSGSQRILDLMRRKYTVHQAETCLRSLRSSAPHIRLQTHIVVGFPGETEDDFCDTVGFLKSVCFDDIAVYEYEDRPFTESSEFPGKLKPKVKKRRVVQLLQEFPRTARPAL